MKFISQFLFAVFVWSLLILRFGYRFGTGDHVELLPYTLFLNDATLYPHDFFIQGLNASVPNERTVMANLLLPFVNHLEWSCFIFHFLTVVVLVLGLERLARRFIDNKYAAWFAVLVSLLPLNDFALGNVDLYSDCVQAGGLSVAIVVWAMVFFINRKFLLASVLMSGATFVQLLDGLDVMIVLSSILLLAALRHKISVKMFVGFVSIYACTAGVYLLLIFIQKNLTANVSDHLLFKILFEFRHPHHFIFSSFPKLKMIVFFTLILGAFYFYFTRSKTLFTFIVIGLAGTLVYAFAVDVLNNVFVGNFQFYKVSQWMKFFGVVALVGIFEKVLNFRKESFTNFKYTPVVLMFASVLCWVVILKFNTQLPYKVPFQIFDMKQSNPMISIAQAIRENTPKESVFIQPFENTELKYYSQRSSYVEFKANVRNKAFVPEWMKRINLVYGLDLKMKQKGFELQAIANQNYYELSSYMLTELKHQGVTHMLIEKNRGFVPGIGTKVIENNTYAVYQL